LPKKSLCKMTAMNLYYRLADTILMKQRFLVSKEAGNSKMTIT